MQSTCLISAMHCGPVSLSRSKVGFSALLVESCTEKHLAMMDINWGRKETRFVVCCPQVAISDRLAPLPARDCKADRACTLEPRSTVRVLAVLSPYRGTPELAFLVHQLFSDFR